jgi:hypothetical protein
MLGSTVDLDWYYPDSSTLYCANGAAVVGGGVEYPAGCLGFSPVSIDITDSGMTVTNPVGWATGAFNGFNLSVLAGPGISAASYLGGTMGNTGLTLDASGLWVNFAGQGGGTAYFSVTAIPEPGTYALLGLGLLGVAAAAQRRRRADA